ncbi:LuxR C-terminal-related transcriptional regulator [Dactylosporangium sp. NPDC000555]|uniref:response regulator transcription factor n=1 Tax=Dactylosporangium sp. NPDC000555 TaxID=3154260 RepID=UPI0033169081
MRRPNQAILSRESSQPTPDASLVEVTDGERDVLALLGAGLSNAEIGERLRLAVTTVKTHVANLMTKTGSANRVQLAVLAVRLGRRCPGRGTSSRSRPTLRLTPARSVQRARRP